jgi:aminopeptidase N
LLEKLPTTQPLSWWIPYNFVIENTPDFTKTTPDGWIPQGTASITIAPTATRTWTNDEWILFNKQQTGYYRVNYDAKLWELLATELLEGDFNKIHVLNRAQLIDDAYTFARVDQSKYSTAFMLMEYLSKEMDYVPWVAANRALTAIDRLMAGSDKYDHFKVGLHLINSKTYFFTIFLFQIVDFCSSHGSTNL